jgi:hypothetical protein
MWTARFIVALDEERGAYGMEAYLHDLSHTRRNDSGGVMRLVA